MFVTSGRPGCPRQHLPLLIRSSGPLPFCLFLFLFLTPNLSGFGVIVSERQKGFRKRDVLEPQEQELLMTDTGHVTVLKPFLHA